MPHANAPLSELGRLRLARFCVLDGGSQALAAERFQVSITTVRRWTARYRQVAATGRVPGVVDMVDRSSRPHRCPTRTAPRSFERQSKVSFRVRRPTIRRSRCSESTALRF